MSPKGRHLMLAESPVGAICAGALIALFAASAFAKIAHPADVRRWLGELFPAGSPVLLAQAVFGTEVAILVAMLVVPVVGAVAAFIWLSVASTALFLARHRVGSCGCFGRRQRLGPAVVVRNGLAIILSVLVMILLAPIAASTPAMAGALLAGVPTGIAIVVLRDTSIEEGALA